MPWIEIFKGGKQIDSSGRPHDGDALIDAAVAKFDTGSHSPPLVLGHPRDDSPAYGWVGAVKSAVTDGVKRLLADISPVEPLKDWVNAGLYRNRSAAFYADGRLRHVGFLGGTPPAVKGLAPLPAFSDDAGIIEFVEKPETINHGNGKGEFRMKFSEFMSAINIFKKLGGQDEDIDLIAPAGPVAPAGEIKTFTEADIEAAKKQAAAEAAAEAKRQVEAQFAETEKARRKEARKTEIKAFCDAGVKAGTLAPAWVQAGIAEFMEQLADEAAAAIEFCEGAVKKTPDAWFREFLGGLPKLVNFGEVATRGKDVGGGEPGSKLADLTKQKMAANQGMSYSAAFSEVQREHPQLAAEYAAELGR